VGRIAGSTCPVEMAMAIQPGATSVEIQRRAEALGIFRAFLPVQPAQAL
jgi:hypothetical protein